MIEMYFALFFVCGVAWGLALAPFNKPMTKNFFKFELKQDSSGITSIVKEAKDHMTKGKLA